MRLFLIITLLFNLLYSHGLEMSKAYITIREPNHLSMKLNFDALEILERIYTSQKRSFDFNSFANLSDDKLKLEFEAIKSKVEAIDIEVDNIDLESKYFRFMEFEEFKTRLKEEFMAFIVNRHEQKNHKPFINFGVFADGFLPKESKKKLLKVLFPSELDSILVTFAKPKTVMIRPDENSSKYELSLE